MSKLREAIERLTEEHARTLAFISRYADQFEPVVTQLQRFEPQLVLTDTSLVISIIGDKHALEAVFGVLRRAGFKFNERPKAGMPVFSTLCTKDGCGYIYFSFSSTVCRRVKVGTRMVEQDLYEVVCDEQSFPPSPEPALAVHDDIPF